MDYSHIKGRIESLRGELADIAEHNRRYFSRKRHSTEECPISNRYQEFR